MRGTIFIIQDDNSLQSLTEESFINEDQFQELLGRYSDLLSGGQIDELNPRRWLLISREMGIPDEDNGNDRWSLDHLFIDQDGIPTLVEVKRSTDTRIRREVVGQMLDYAANAVVYWPIEIIKAKFEANCEQRGIDPFGEIEKFLMNDTDSGMRVDDFWDRIKTNLKIGKIRLIFVADNIPVELKRIVEFLNTQMNPAEVLALEIKQYIGKGIRTLVPQVIGRTSGAERKKASSRARTRQWDEVTFLQELELQKGKGYVRIANKLLAWSNEKLLKIRYGKGYINGVFILGRMHNGKYHELIEVWTNGRVVIRFGYLNKLRPFDDDTMWLELHKRLNQIPSINFLDNSINKFPNIPFEAIKDDESFNLFLDVLDWAIGQVLSSDHLDIIP